MAKRRPADQPLLWLVADLGQAAAYVDVGPRALHLAALHWPGALTLILPSRTDGSPQGVRQPAHPLALALLRRLGEPLAASSANLHAEAPAADAGTARVALGSAVTAVLDGSPRPGGEASTIIDLTSPAPRLVRSGTLWRERLSLARRSHV
jgi:L-threonylcarbamoyladenylate synthase